MFDVHCHLDRCADSPEHVLDRARMAGVTDLIIAGVEHKTWAKQTALAGPGVHIAWGIHPWRIAEAPGSWRGEHQALCDLLNQPPVKPVALGETGLDYGRRFEPASRPHQEQAFRQQIRLSKKHGLPLILHVVRAHNDAIRILKEEGAQQVGGMVHSFGGNAEQAQQYIRLNLHISFAGSIVDPKNQRVRAAAVAIPSNRLLVETDSPDQTPKTRKPLPNEPAFLIDVLAALADLRAVSVDRMASVTTTNARTLFGIQPT